MYFLRGQRFDSGLDCSSFWIKLLCLKSNALLFEALFLEDARSIVDQFDMTMVSCYLSCLFYLSDSRLCWKQRQVGLVVAGGSVSALLKPDTMNDLDIFLYGPSSILATDIHKDVEQVTSVSRV